ncbi:MAG TPA: ribose 5-phosphate isomerase B [Anaerolineaceae bacterium]|nr:ribose 5-phosphate isomerase B [Anaerolineaceae bacterium]
MRIAIGCDHAGFPLKDFVIETVRQAGHAALDFGTYNTERVDYPDFVEKVGRAIQNGEAERGIVICGSGVGACITANKMKGIFACLCHDTYSAHQGVEHDRMNVLCLGGRIIGPELARELVLAFLSANFNNEERFVRRIDKIEAIEKRG